MDERDTNDVKDFDFQLPAGGGRELQGTVAIPRDLADCELARRTPFDAFHALLDLWFLANTEARTHKHPRGPLIQIDPGDSLWSAENLAKRWGWGASTVRKFLQAAVEAKHIKLIPHNHGYIIRILDYPAHASPCQATSEAACQATSEAACQATSEAACQAAEREKEIGVKEKGVGEGGGDGGAAAPPVFSLEAVMNFARNWNGDLYMHIPPGIPDGWAFNYHRWRSTTTIPADWPGDMTTRFKSDWLDASSNGHASARNLEKNTPPPSGRKNPPQAGEKVTARLW